jgi:heparanase 1
MGHSALVLALAFVLVVAFGGSTAAAAAAAPLRAGRQQQQQAVTVTVDGSAILATTSDRYVSFTADWHVCEVEQPAVPPARCNWHNASILRWNLSRLLPYARGLSPYRTALLRIGGGPADNAVYDVGPTPRPALRRNGTAQGSYVSSCPGPLCLTMQRWDELNAFASQAGIQIVFGLNALSARMTQGSGGKSRVISGVEWDTTNVRALLEYTKQKGFVERGSLYGFELGK